MQSIYSLGRKPFDIGRGNSHAGEALACFSTVWIWGFGGSVGAASIALLGLSAVFFVRKKKYA